MSNLNINHNFKYCVDKNRITLLIKCMFYRIEDKVCSIDLIIIYINIYSNISKIFLLQ